VYSQTLGYPHAADDAARALLAALEHNARKRVSVGMTNDRAFLFCTGIGFDASVIRRVERHSRRLKRLARSRRRSIRILSRHPLHTSARKAHLYPAREFLSFQLKTILSGGRTLRSAADCALWYDGRR
jgi:diacylglycerol kinase family enzyme